MPGPRGLLKNDGLLQQLNARKVLYGLEDADVHLQSTLNRNAIPDKKAPAPETEKYLKLMTEKNQRIRELENTIGKQNPYDSTFQQEFRALFGGIKELSVSKMLLYNDSNRTDTFILVYIKPGRCLTNTTQLKNRLMARYKTDKVRLITN